MQRGMPMREILVRLLVPLLHAVMKHHRHCVTALSDVIDRKLFRWLAMEVLIRTQKELHRLDLRSAVSPDGWVSVRMAAVRRAVFASHPPPAHNFFSLYHSNITKREPVSASMELVAPMCDAYNAALGAMCARRRAPRSTRWCCTIRTQRTRPRSTTRAARNSCCFQGLLSAVMRTYIFTFVAVIGVLGRGRTCGAFGERRRGGGAARLVRRRRALIALRFRAFCRRCAYLTVPL